jgi:hypothetical protein
LTVQVYLLYLNIPALMFIIICNYVLVSKSNGKEHSMETSMSISEETSAGHEMLLTFKSIGSRLNVTESFA